jgi:hypothetical protein
MNVIMRIFCDNLINVEAYFQKIKHTKMSKNSITRYALFSEALWIILIIRPCNQHEYISIT